MSKKVTEHEDFILREARRLYGNMFGDCLDVNDETPTLIIDRLYLGSVVDAKDLYKLKEKNIKYVLNMAGSVSYGSDFFSNEGLGYIELLSLEAHDLDDYDISQHFPVALNFIEKSLTKNDGSVLVHCSAGVSRSPTIVAAYLMAKQKRSTYDIIEKIHRDRPCVCPNIGFLRQLFYFKYDDFQFG